MSHPFHQAGTGVITDTMSDVHRLLLYWTVYQRLSVIAMGSLVSVIVANVVMENGVLNMSLVPTIFWSTPRD